MSTSRRSRRALYTVLAVTGLTGTVILAPAESAFGQDPDRSPSAATDTDVWTDSAGWTVDANGHRLEDGSPTAGHTTTAAASDPAEDGSWSLLGPPGGDIFDVAVSPADPSIVLAGFAPNGTGGGTLYRSGDGGTTWSEVPALHGTSVYDIDFAPDGTVTIGTIDGVWHSDDGGQSWVARDLNIGLNDQVFDVAIDPTDPSVLWAGIGNALGFQTTTLMRSTDNGLTWTNRTPPFVSPLSGRAIAIDPNDPDTVVVGFDGGQVWVTTDGGTTWANRSAGLPAGPVNEVVYDGSRLLVGGGQLFGSQFFGLHQSTDLGLTWSTLHDDTWPVPIVAGIAVDPSDRDTILVATAGTGVHRTTDGGATWETSIGGTGSLTGRSVSFTPGSSTEVFLSTDSQAVYRSTDGGDSFVQSSTGIAETDIYAVTANPLDPDQVAIAFQGLNGGGVFSSVDGGTTWQAEPVPPTRYSDVQFAPDGTLYALSSGPSSVAPEGLYRRESGGNWTSLGPDQGSLFESDLSAIRFSPNDPDLIVLGGADFGVAGSEATVWRSADRGQTWTKAYEGPDNEMVIDVEIVSDGTDQEMLASVSDFSQTRAGGVIRSEDAGRSWFPSTIGLPGGQFLNPNLCASSADPHVAYLAGGPTFDTTNLYRSTDGGVTWASTGWTGDALSTELACDPADGRVLYLLRTTDPFVLRSTDGGVTFIPFGDGLEAVRQPRALAFADTSRMLMASARGSYGRDLERDAITLDATAHKVRGRFVADLTWQGSTSAEIDVYRDGALIATVPNTGSHTDPVAARDGTATYQVCRVDSSVCSNEVTVNFR